MTVAKSVIHPVVSFPCSEPSDRYSSPTTPNGITYNGELLTYNGVAITYQVEE